MRKIKRKIICLILSFSCVIAPIQEAYAIPIAVPVLIGGIAAFATACIYLGYQTNEINDFHDMFSSFDDSTRKTFNDYSLSDKFTLSKTIAQLVNEKIQLATNGATNKVQTLVSHYLTEIPTGSNSEKAVPLQISKDTRLNTTVNREFFVGEGYYDFKFYCYQSTPNPNIFRSSSIKLGNIYFKLQYNNSGGNQCTVLYSSDNSNFSYCKGMGSVLDPYSNSWVSSVLTFRTGEFTDNGSSSTGAHSFYKLAVNDSNQIVMSRAFFTRSYGNTSFSNTLLQSASGQIFDISTDLNAQKALNSEHKINALPVDVNKAVGSVLPSKSLTASDVLYDNGAIKASDKPVVDPIVKSSTGSSTGDSGGLTLDLSGVLGFLSKILDSITNGNSDAKAFFAKAVIFFETMSISGIATAVSTAFNPLISSSTDSLLRGINVTSDNVRSDLKDIQMEQERTTNAVIAGQPDLNLDGNYSLNWEPLKITPVLSKKFPFSIPYDLYNSVKALNAPSQCPKWTIDFSGVLYGAVPFTIDFKPFEPLARVVRWGTLVIFNIGLILITRQIIGEN